MDKGYDSEPLHEWLDDNGVWSIAPVRRGCQHGVHRLRLRDALPEAEYAQRNIVESVFSSIKQRFGGHVSGRTARTIRAELLLRLTIYNMIVSMLRLFLQRRR
jgi:transposase